MRFQGVHSCVQGRRCFGVARELLKTAMRIALTFPFAFSDGSTSCKHISTDFSLSSSRIDGSPETKTRTSISSTNCQPGSNILLKNTTALLSAPVAEIIMYIAVRPCKMMLVNRFCLESIDVSATVYDVMTTLVFL